MAVGQPFGQSIEAVPIASNDEGFHQTKTDATEFTVVPVENSTKGTIGRTRDLLLSTPLRICAEIVLRVHQNLMAKSDSLAGITRVYSHAQSLAQCHQWLSRNLAGAERVQVASNAEAARLAAGEAAACAVGPATAAERYGLHLLARNLEDEPNN